MQFLNLQQLKLLRPRGDDDFVDRLNYYYTVLILGLASIVVSAKQYVAKPIQCWIPELFSSSMEQYIESYCWIQNTYFVPMYAHIPDDYETRENKQIGYYQWVPFILLAEAIMFSLPCFLWRVLNWQTGMNLYQLISSANKVQQLGFDQRQEAIDSLADSVDTVLALQAGSRSTNYQTRCFFIRPWRLYGGSYVTCLYLLIKICYTANVALQFFLLNTVLKSEVSVLYGIQVLTDLYHGRTWQESGHFPRITLCDFEVRHVGNLNRYTVQCALLVNLFNEKIFAFVWCWFLVLAAVTGCSLVFWSFNSIFAIQRLSFVLKYLNLAANQPLRAGMAKERLFCAPTALYDRFILKHLRTDGVFILRMMANHCGDIVTMEVVKALWRNFREDHNWELEMGHKGSGAGETTTVIYRPLDMGEARLQLRQTQAHSMPPIAKFDEDGLPTYEKRSISMIDV